MVNQSTDEVQLDVLVHLAECIFYFLSDGGNNIQSEEEAEELVTDCQTMALLIAKSMSFSVSSIENEEITIKIKLSDPVEFLDNELNS